MNIIPFKEPGAWQIQIILSNVIYILQFKWNALNSYWVMNILNQNAEPIVQGIKVVTNYDLTAQFPLLGMPSGDILCQNILNEWFDIQRISMGETNELVYYEPGELASVVAGATT